MRLTLVVPRLAAVPADTLSRISALARLAAYGASTSLPLDLDAALIEAAGASSETPVAPLAALGAGFDPGDSYVLRADPVALVAGRDDVLLTGRIDDLTAAQSQAIIDMLNGHFANDGLQFRAARPDAWFVMARDVPVETSPLAAVQGLIQPHLPHGDHGKTWRRWLSEMQMLLHAHPVNAQRDAGGRALVTGIWVSGGGIMPRHMQLAQAAIHAPHGPDGDVARGLALCAHRVATPAPAGFATLGAHGDALVVVPAVATDDTVATIARDWLDPAVIALERGALTDLTLLADGGGHTLRWRAATPSWWRRLRVRL